MADVKISLSSNYACVQPEIANVVIIGGGVMGMSAAWNLASRGVKGIVVLNSTSWVVALQQNRWAESVQTFQTQTTSSSASVLGKVRALPRGFWGQH